MALFDKGLRSLQGCFGFFHVNFLEVHMLNWVITFFILAIVAAFFGFGGLAGTFAEIAKLLAIMFVVLFVASLIYSMVSGRRPPVI